MNVYLLLLFSSTWALSPLEQWQDRIINGSNAKRHQFPYIVSLYNYGFRLCGASILSHTWIVSAAHCLKPVQNLNNLTAIAGLLNQNEVHPDIQKMSISKAIAHPDYINDVFELTLKNDIALLNLAQPLVFSKAVQPVKLPRSNDIFSGKVWMAGWGSYTLPETAPITLQCLEMTIITNKECQDARITSPGYEILDQMICTTPLPMNHNSTACHGDSGGPLVQNGVLVGITSFGVNSYCGTDVEVPTNVFTRVSSLLKFINSYVKDI